METSKFRVNAKSLFITYPQCPVGPDEMFVHLKAVVTDKRWNIVDYVVAQEAHKDGHSHLHAWILFATKVNLKDNRAFDYLGHHPNIQGVRCNSDVLKYVTKDGNFISNKTYEELKDQMTSREDKRAHLATQLLETGLTYNLI